MDKVPLSVVVITKNEEKNLAECLGTVRWADEIIVVDDQSTDRTQEIARQYTDRVITRKMDIEGAHRNYAYSLARNEWVLTLDADERVTPQLRDEIAGILEADTDCNGFAIPRRNFLGDRWLAHGGNYPSPQLKLFRRDRFRWEEAEVHPRAFMQDPRGRLKNDLIHYTYRDISDVIKKLDNQTTLEARKWIKDKRKMGLGKALRRTIDRFFRAYISKKGHLDGVPGLVMAVAGGMYQFISYAKYWELKKCQQA